MLIPNVDSESSQSLIARQKYIISNMQNCKYAFPLYQCDHRNTLLNSELYCIYAL